LGSALLLCLSQLIFQNKRLALIAFPFMEVVIVLLIAVLIPSVGQQVGGARRWIDLGFFSLQPTEFAKI
jgi:cell division protein FtsW